MKTDDDLETFVNKRVRVTLDNGATSDGILWRDDDNGRPRYQLAPSGPGKAGFFAPEMQFYATQVDEIESL